MGSIQLKSVRKSFGVVSVINGVDLDIKNGEFVVFVGPSGCGKSTLLRLIAGLEDVNRGDVLIDGEDVTDVGRRAARAGHGVPVLRALSAHERAQNIAFALKMATACRRAEIEPKVPRRPACCNLTDYLTASRGSSRAASASASPSAARSCASPGVFLFDEPLSNLDAELRVQMRVEIGDLHKRAQDAR